MKFRTALEGATWTFWKASNGLLNPRMTPTPEALGCLALIAAVAKTEKLGEAAQKTLVLVGERR